MTKHDLSNISEKISQILTEKIIKQEFKSGDRLIEIKLAKELNVSQGSIREALRILEKKGLVTINPRRGTTVTPVTESSVEWLYDILTELYCLLIRKNAPKVTTEVVKTIFKILDKLKESAANNDYEVYYSTTFEFGNNLITLADNPLIETTIQELWLNKRRIEYKTILLRKARLHENVKYFDLIKKYIEQANIIKVEETMREYMDVEKKSAIDMLKQ